MENQRLKQLFSFLKKDPVDSFTLYSIGLEYMNLEAWEMAQSYFLKLYEANPAYLGTYYQYGKCLRLLGDDEAAKRIYKQGMALAREQGKQHTFSELKNELMNTEIGEDP